MIELHLHLDGSLRPETVLALAKAQGIKLPADTVEGILPYLQAPESCQNLNEYLTCFDLPLSVLQKREALTRAAFELMEDLAGEGVTYAEIRFAPQLSTKQGLSQEEAVDAVFEGIALAMQKYPIAGGLILCLMRGDSNAEENLKTVEVARKYLGQKVCAIDLAGAEALYKTENYKEIFQRARDYQIPFTIHAGEADGPESIRAALMFGARRIGHGVRAIEDEALVRQFVKDKIPLEICVISNLQTKAVPKNAIHPVRALFDKGVLVTINTDNRTVSHTNLQKEYDYLCTQYGFTEAELKTMESYARKARFMQ